MSSIRLGQLGESLKIESTRVGFKGDMCSLSPALSCPRLPLDLAIGKPLPDATLQYCLPL